ncbi:ferredoxin [Rhodococcus sp. NPDC059968]|uniref:ferredoxin n=1 Tax=Rhodococcus sp. NPDC059968 TaxID=3347017 RepID=UPI003670FDE6
MRIEVDWERCIGAGMCALTAPDVFEQDENDGRVVVRKKHVGADHLDAVHEAVRLCPSGALALRSAEK